MPRSRENRKPNFLVRPRNHVPRFRAPLAVQTEQSSFDEIVSEMVQFGAADTSTRLGNDSFGPHYFTNGVSHVVIWWIKFLDGLAHRNVNSFSIEQFWLGNSTFSVYVEDQFPSPFVFDLLMRENFVEMKSPAMGRGNTHIDYISD